MCLLSIQFRNTILPLYFASLLHHLGVILLMPFILLLFSLCRWYSVFLRSIHTFCISLDLTRILKFSRLTLYVHFGYVYIVGLEMLSVSRCVT